MRLIKINDIILNMENIAVIKAENRGEDYGGEVVVYAYTVNDKILLGICGSIEDYQTLINEIYKKFNETFLDEVIIEKDEELWK